MGLIKAAKGAVTGVLADQWKDFFYCEAMAADILMVKGQSRVDPRSANKNGSDNIISSGSVIAVADGQAMIIVEQGQIVEFCAEPGEFVYNTSTEPSVFNGTLEEGVKQTFKNMGKRFTFGGQAGKDQRIYYFNLKEITGNKYGTPAPVPFRVVDNNIGLDIDISIRCNGQYSYRITDPLLLYANVCGNVSTAYNRSQLDSQLKAELLTKLQPAFARVSEMGIRYSALPGHTIEISTALNDLLSEKWSKLRGISITAFSIKSITALPEDEQLIKDLQRKAVMRNADMAGATLVTAQADAMRSAAQNPGGAMMGILGMNAAMNTGANANGFFQMAEQQRASAPPQVAKEQGGWVCPCGVNNTGKFCSECGAAQPSNTWVCPCGVNNAGRFCSECGAAQPSNTWVCPCGVNNAGRFCSECGAAQPSNTWNCSCGQQNSGRFCANCGTPKN